MPDTVFLPDRIEVTRPIAAPPSAIFDIVRSPAGHVAIDASGMLQDYTGEAAEKVGDTFVIHMDRESLNDFPLGKYDVTVHIITFEQDREIALEPGRGHPVSALLRLSPRARRRRHDQRHVLLRLVADNWRHQGALPDRARIGVAGHARRSWTGPSAEVSDVPYDPGACGSCSCPTCTTRCKQLDWVTSVAGDYDLVVLAGDHLDIASIVAPDAQIAVVLEYLARIAAKTTVDRVLRATTTSTPATSSASAPRSGSTRRAAPACSSTGRSSRPTHVLITVCPWWDGPLTREVGRPPARRRRGARRRPRVDLGVPRAARRVADELDRESGTTATPTSSAWIEQHQPAIVLCGHVHQSPFMPDGAWIDRIGSTTVFNAGRQPGPVPTCDHPRHRHRRRPVVVGDGRRGAARRVRARLVLGLGIALRAELARAPGPASGCRARRRPCRGRPRGRRTGA